MDYIKLAQDIIASKEGIIAAYGYGSSFFHQSGYNSKTIKSMDFIFVVDDIKQWFLNDIEKNAIDYTENTKKKFLKLKRKCLKGCTGIVYNVVRNREVKYKFGVIEKQDFITNLSSWKSFYVTGRLQKPVYSFKSDKQLDEIIDLNRKNALIASAIILNKEETSITELFETLCSLSYKGDIRFIIENPNKVSNIVKGSLENLKEIYQKYDFVRFEDDKAFISLDDIYSNLDNTIFKYNNVKKTKLGKKILKKIKHINFKESIFQPIKGLKVSGIKDSLSYVKEKAKKKKIK